MNLEGMYDPENDDGFRPEGRKTSLIRATKSVADLTKMQNQPSQMAHKNRQVAVDTASCEMEAAIMADQASYAQPQYTHRSVTKKFDFNSKIQSENGFGNMDNEDDDYKDAGTVYQTNQPNKPDEVKNSVMGAFLALISTIIGGGIVSIPYAFAASGFFVGLAVQATVCICMVFTVRLYLQARDQLQLDSLSDIAYACMGRSSVIVLNVLLTLCIIGVITLYMILFANICISLAVSNPESTSILAQKTTYVLLLSAVMIPVFIKKKITDLKAATYLLFAGVISLLLVFVFRLISTGPVVSTPWESGKVVTAESVMDSANITVTSYGFIINFFPIYATLKEKTNRNGFISAGLALAFGITAYTLFASLAILSYGYNIDPSIFENIKEDDNIISVALRCLFLVIFLCNIPFIFFAGKEALLNVVAELSERMVSRKMDERFAGNQVNMLNDNQSDFDFNETENDADTESHLSSLLDQVTRPKDRADKKTAQKVERMDIDQRLELELSKIEEEDAESVINRVTKSMGEQVSPKTYYVVLFSYLSIIVIMAITISDLTFIFGFIAGVSETFLNFIFPACFAYLAAKKTGNTLSVLEKISIFIFGMIGVTFCIVANYFNVMKMMRGETPSH